MGFLTSVRNSARRTQLGWEVTALDDQIYAKATDFGVQLYDAIKTFQSNNQGTFPSTANCLQPEFHACRQAISGVEDQICAHNQTIFSNGIDYDPSIVASATEVVAKLHISGLERDIRKLKASFGVTVSPTIAALVDPNRAGINIRKIRHELEILRLMEKHHNEVAPLYTQRDSKKREMHCMEEVVDESQPSAGDVAKPKEGDRVAGEKDGLNKETSDPAKPNSPNTVEVAEEQNKQKLSYWQRMNSMEMDEPLFGNKEADATQDDPKKDGEPLASSQRQNIRTDQRTTARSPKRSTSSSRGRQTARKDLPHASEKRSKSSPRTTNSAATTRGGRTGASQRPRATEVRSKSAERSRRSASTSRSSSNPRSMQTRNTKDSAPKVTSTRNTAVSIITRKTSQHNTHPRHSVRTIDSPEKQRNTRNNHLPQTSPSAKVNSQPLNRSAETGQKATKTKVSSKSSVSKSAKGSKASKKPTSPPSAVAPKSVLQKSTSKLFKKKKTSASGNRVRFDPSVVASTSTLIEEAEDLEYSDEKAVQIVRMEL